MHTYNWPLRVYYEDTDAQGIVFYANYLKFMERARTEMFRKLDISPTKIKHESQTHIVVRRCDLIFRQSAVLEDDLHVATRFVSAAGARIILKQIVRRNEEDLVSAEVELALVSQNGRPQRVSSDLLGIIKPYISADN